MALHNELGKWGEEQAACFLEQQGMRVISRNWRYGHRDLDIVAIDADGTCVIVEVKTRSNEVFADADRSVTPQKIRSLSIAANAFVKAHHVSGDIRFDIVTIVGNDEACEVKHTINAFLPFI